ncbi:MAG: substrate-binding domain-containing protein, partial [Chloroflexota bacterium]
MKRIGIVTTEQYKPFQMQIIEGIQAVTGQECELVIDSLGEDPTMRKDFSLDTRLLDGLIVIADVLTDDTILSLHAEGIPMTLVSHLLDDARIPSVIQNNIDGMTQLMNYMIADCQRNNLVFIQGNLAQGDSRERLSLFQAGMMRHDLSPDDALYIEGNGDPVIAGNAILELLDSNTSFDGIVASHQIIRG